MNSLIKKTHSCPVQCNKENFYVRQLVLHISYVVPAFNFININPLSFMPILPCSSRYYQQRLDVIFGHLNFPLGADFFKDF